MKLVTTALVFAAICIWMACSIDELPFEPMGDPAAKMTVAEDACFVIQWDCDPSMWMTEADSVYSVFYQNYRFQTRGSAVILTEYIDDSSKREYEAHPTLFVLERKRARFQWTDDGKCGLWSDAIRDTTVAVRVFEGDVQWRYRSLPSHTQYAVKEDGVSYKIATVNADTTLRYVDFYSFHNRLKAPPSLDGQRYYLPINFSQSALDTLLHIPDNDSLYIESPFRCEDDESCAEWPEAMCPEPEPVVVEEVETRASASVSEAAEVSAEQDLPISTQLVRFYLANCANEPGTSEGCMQFRYFFAEHCSGARGKSEHCVRVCEDVLGPSNVCEDVPGVLGLGCRFQRERLGEEGDNLLYWVCFSY